MFFVVAFLSTLVFIVSIDYAWYQLLRHTLYPSIAGLRDRLKLGGVIGAYLVLSGGLTFYAILPAYVGGSAWYAVVLGAIFGAVVYGVHAGGGYALMRGVPLWVAVLEWGRGAVLMAVVCAGSYAVLRLIGF